MPREHCTPCARRNLPTGSATKFACAGRSLRAALPSPTANFPLCGLVWPVSALDRHHRRCGADWIDDLTTSGAMFEVMRAGYVLSQRPQPTACWFFRNDVEWNALRKSHARSNSRSSIHINPHHVLAPLLPPGEIYLRKVDQLSCPAVENRLHHENSEVIGHGRGLS